MSPTPDIEDAMKHAGNELVRLYDVCTLLAETNDFRYDSCRDILLASGLQDLRPTAMFNGMDTFGVNDDTNSKVSDAVSIELGDDPRTYAKAAIESSNTDEFSWSIVQLVRFCEERELRVPEAWQTWMIEAKPLLDRVKLRDAAYDPLPDIPSLSTERPLNQQSSAPLTGLDEHHRQSLRLKLESSH